MHEEQQAPLSHVLISGALGGALGDSFMHPLDTIKTIQQGSGAEVVAAKYRTTPQALKTVLREEGIRKGYFKGYTAMLIGSAPTTMLFFGSYELFKRGLSEKTPLNPTLIHLTSGFLGDLVSSVVYVPSEVLKTRLQVQPSFYSKGQFNNIMKYNYKGLTDAVRQIAKYEGLGTLFHGYKATLMRDLPYSALQFAFYERFRKMAKERNGPELGLSMELATGAAAGGLAGTITTPLDVIKTRIQTQTGDEIKGMVSGLKHVFRNEGFIGIMGGVGPRVVLISIQSSIMLLVYQTSLKMLRDY